MGCKKADIRRVLSLITVTKSKIYYMCSLGDATASPRTIF